jgi:hypothetical protein
VKALQLLVCAIAGSACVTTPKVPEPPRMTVAEVSARIPTRVSDREGWATDVLAALEQQHRPADPDTVCQVLAIIEQESNFQANPAVPGLPRMIKTELEKRVEKLGPLGPPALRELLSGKAPGTKLSFEQRLDTLKTERDLDLLFRDILDHYRERFPAPLKALDLFGALFGASPDDFNPVTTVGSMQVSVEFAEKLADRERREVSTVRDELYTRSGGVYYGTARLLAHEAAYTQPLYRFADYNAGVYASRNAALQEQVATLLKLELVLDGDLLAYDKHGEPLSRETNTSKAIVTFAQRFAPELTERRIRRDLEEEKTARFESTDTWRAIKRVYAQRMKADPPYARVPEVTLKSPKLTSDRSTAWFAKNVDLRYQRCLGR